MGSVIEPNYATRIAIIPRIGLGKLVRVDVALGAAKLEFK